MAFAFHITAAAYIIANVRRLFPRIVYFSMDDADTFTSRRALGFGHYSHYIFASTPPPWGKYMPAE